MGRLADYDHVTSDLVAKTHNVAETNKLKQVKDHLEKARHQSVSAYSREQNDVRRQYEKLLSEKHKLSSTHDMSVLRSSLCDTPKHREHQPGVRSNLSRRSEDELKYSPYQHFHEPVNGHHSQRTTSGHHRFQENGVFRPKHASHPGRSHGALYSQPDSVHDFLHHDQVHIAKHKNGGISPNSQSHPTIPMSWAQKQRQKIIRDRELEHFTYSWHGHSHKDPTPHQHEIVHDKHREHSGRERRLSSRKESILPQLHQTGFSMMHGSTTPSYSQKTDNTPFMPASPSSERYIHGIPISALKQYEALMEENALREMHESKTGPKLPRVYGPVCINTKRQPKKILAFEMLLNQLHNEEQGFDPSEILKCRYLRLSRTNVDTLTQMCRDAGIDVTVHPHMHQSQLDLFQLKPASSNENYVED